VRSAKGNKKHEFYVGCTHRRPVVDRLREYIAGRDLNGLGEAGCDSLTWPRVDGWNWLHLCGRGCAVVTV
jgi:hypothetical protein